MEMDQREISRINMKYGKFLDPFMVICLVLVFTFSILSVRSLTPRSFSYEQRTNVLGVQQEEGEFNFELIRGQHNYISNENLKEISPTHYKYSAFVKQAPKGRISKPIVKFEISEEADLKAQLIYTNATNSKISLFDERKNTNYILQQNTQNYSPNINIREKSNTYYLVIENEKPLYFDQYIEVSFFLNL